MAAGGTGSGTDSSEQLCTEYPEARLGYPCISVLYVTLVTCTTVLRLHPEPVSESRRERKERTRADLLQAALLLLEGQQLRQPEPA